MKAIVTGHSRGLGAAITETLLNQGIPVLGLARHINDDLAQRSPQALQQIRVDLADPAALAAWISAFAWRDFIEDGEALILVNNAGTVQPVGALDRQDPAEVGRAVSLNVAAPLMLAAVVAQATKGERRVLHVSSGAGRSAYAGWSVYCATKAALDHHARSAAADNVRGLRVCSVAPGVIDTDMQAEIRGTSLEQFPLRERFEAMKRQGALATPHACAQRLVAYLLDESFGSVPVTDLRDLG